MQDAGEVPGKRLPKGFFAAFGLTWVAYASYYLCRKNFGVTKSAMQTELALTEGTLVAIETALLATYAVGQLISGRMGDRIGARRLIGAGMITSAALCIGFGASNHAWAFILFFGLNGLAQSTGWPGTVKAMAEWTEPTTRGRAMGFWATCYQVGGVAATAVATFMLVRWGWRSSFWVPALWVALVGVAVWLLLKRGPSATHLPATPEMARADSKAAQAKLLRSPIIWCYGASYVSLKLIRYSILLWLPYYLERALGFTGGMPGYLSTSFEIGGVAGTLLFGYLSDRFIVRFPRSVIAAVAMVGLAGALLIYGSVGASGAAANFFSMALVGSLLFAADSLISGAAAQDAGGANAAALAAGIVNGVGSVGAVLQGIVTVTVKRIWGWDALFYVFVVLSLLGAAALIPTFKRRKAF